MNTTIIGAEGRMGGWLVDFFKSKGHVVSSYDERRGDNDSILKDSDLVVVSVPLDSTSEVVAHAAENMAPRATLMEVASLKMGVVDALKEASSNGLKVSSVHPMFGPSAGSLEGKTVAVVPVSDSEEEVRLASRFFRGAELVQVDAEQHDRLMTHILCMPYLVNTALAATLGRTDLDLLKSLAGTSFTLQYALMHSITGESAELIHALVSQGEFLDETIECFMENMAKIQNTANFFEEFKELLASIKTKMEEDPIHRDGGKLRTAAFNAVRPYING